MIISKHALGFRWKFAPQNSHQDLIIDGAHGVYTMWGFMFLHISFQHNTSLDPYLLVTMGNHVQGQYYAYPYIIYGLPQIE